MDFYHPNITHFTRVCQVGFYPGKYENYALVRSQVPIPALLAFAGYPLTTNQPCFRHRGNTGRVMSIYQHSQDASWLFYCRYPKCGANGDVTEMWYQMVRYSGFAPPRWTKAFAAADLLARVKASEIDTSITSLSDYATSPAKESPLPEDHYGKRLRRLIQERKEESVLGKCALPNTSVRLTVKKVILGLFPENGYLLATPKQSWHDIKMRDEWLSARYYLRGDPPLIERSFISSNLLTRGDLNCCYEAFGERKRRWLVIESDTHSLPEQLWIHKQLAEAGYQLGCVCWSGGKSLHGWYYVEQLSEAECFKLYAQAVRLGVSDSNTWKICQPVRLPNGWNRKTKQKQKVIVWNR